MKGAKKHFSRALTLLLSVLIMLQTVTVPAFAAENTTENVEVATNDASTEEESTFNLIKADVQIDDEYGNETDYISEVQIPDLEQISEETLVENGVSIHSDYPGDAMVYLTQRWLNQEYGDVPGFGYVTEDGRTGWDTVYGLSIIDNSNTVVQTLTVDADLNSGGHTQLKIPFDLPNTLVLSDYTIQVVPHEKK